MCAEGNEAPRTIQNNLRGYLNKLQWNIGKEISENCVQTTMFRFSKLAHISKLACTSLPKYGSTKGFYYITFPNLEIGHGSFAPGQSRKDWTSSQKLEVVYILVAIWTEWIEFQLLENTIICPEELIICPGELNHLPGGTKIAAVPPFPGLRRFPEGRGFKQWTGDDSKALMKVYLPAISGHVPAQMVRAIKL
ncbi:hypothetical protein C8J56DRAFT_889002 [Mycena floridula]|nr:hypothetical protein C8J56DRAFT_889002 [Mycena floridula]